MNNRDEYYVGRIIDMLKLQPEAAEYWERGNSLAGGVLSLTHDVPRQLAEQLVGEAVRRLEEEATNGPQKAR